MEIRVPQLVEGVTSGTVVSILVKAGDKVKKDQGLIELETNKAVASIPAQAEGVVSKIHVAEGAQVSVGQTLITLSDTGASAQPVSSQPSATKSSAAPAAAPVYAPIPATSLPPAAPGSYYFKSPTGATPPASPSVRKLAQDLGIDLYRVRGTEHGGRITLADVRHYVTQLQQSAFSPQAGTSAQEKTAPAPSINFSKWGPVTKKPMTPLRKTIAKAMVNSWTTIPHVTQFDDIDITAAMLLRKKAEAEYDKKGARLTLTAFVLKAIALTLKQFPIFNASLDEATQEIVFKDYYHLGIAVDTEQGLIVPVMRDVDKKSFLEISLELSQIAEKTRARKVSIEDMQGGTFTLSNQGGIGGRHFTPVINKPEVAILGTGRGFSAAVPSQGKIEIRTLMPVGLSYDHRLIDGGSAARWITTFAQVMNSFTEKDLQLSSQTASKSPAAKAKKGKK